MDGWISCGPWPLVVLGGGEFGGQSKAEVVVVGGRKAKLT